MIRGENTAEILSTHRLKTVDNVVQAVEAMRNGTYGAAPSSPAPTAQNAPEAKAEPKKPDAPASADSVAQKNAPVKKDAAKKARKAMSDDKKSEAKDSNAHKSEKDAGKNVSRSVSAQGETHKKIRPGMTDAERYEVLKGRSIENIPTATELPSSVAEKIPEITSWDDLNKYFGSRKKGLIMRIAKEFGVIGREYFNNDINISFEFSGYNFGESYDKQKKNYADFAQTFSVFDAVVENAVGVEVHNRKNYKPDPTLDNIFVLMSAYREGDSIVPVKLEIKKFEDKQNTLYVAISLDKIKMAELHARGNTVNGVTQRTRSTTISIPDSTQKINPPDEISEKNVSRSVSFVESRIQFGTNAQETKISRIKKTVKGLRSADGRREMREGFIEAIDTFSVYASNSFAAVETQLRRMAKDGAWDEYLTERIRGGEQRDS